MKAGAVALLILTACAPIACAADHRNLDAGIPVTVEDAYTVKFREPTFQGIFAYQRLRGSVNQRGLLPELEYCIARDWQLDVGSRLFGRSRGKSEASGNLDVSVLHNFNTETLRLPAFALRAAAEFPTGVDARGVDFTLKGIVTKSLGYNRAHLNVSGTRAGSREGGRRRSRWEGVLGWDRPVGLQSLLIADVVVRQSERRGSAAATELEIGIRRQITPRQVVSFGVGAGLTGRTEKQPVFFRFAISRAL